MENLRTRTPKALKILLFIVICAEFIFMASLCLYFFEKDNQPYAFGSIGSAVQYVLLTFTTIGFADATPLTFSGKVITLLVQSMAYFVAIAFWIWMVFSIVRFGTLFRRKPGEHSRKLEM